MAVTKVCCTCLSFDVAMLSLTDDDIRECLEKVINIQIELKDELLQNICTECVLVMRKFVKFKNKCFSAYQRLREITSQSTCISEALLKAESIKLCSETVVFNNFTISNNILTIQDPNLDNFMKKSDLKFENTDIFESQTNSNIHSYKYDVKIEYSPQHVETELHDSGTQDDLSSINKTLIKSNKFKEELLPASVCKDKEELNIEKSPQRNKFVDSTKKVLVKRKQALWKSDYAIQITLTKEQQKEELFKRRMSENYVNAPFQCSDCVSGFKSEEKFDQHMNLHNKSHGTLQCDICKLRYSYSRRLRVHQRSHKMRYKCLTCGEITESQKQAMIHQKTHQAMIFRCKVCDKRFKQELLYRRHTRTAHPTDYVCDSCGDYFANQLHLTSHKKARADCKKLPTNIFDCKMCDEQFLSLSSWYGHMLGHSKEKRQTPPADCQICGHKTTSWSDWSFHYCSEHRNKHVHRRIVKKKRGIFICDVCGKTLTRKSTLATHILVQHTDKNAVSQNPKFDWQDACEICNKNILRCNMRRHMRTHTGEKPYVCDVCGRGFTQASTRMEHVQRHKTKDKNLCPLCPRKFRSMLGLIRHQETHTGVSKSLPCDVCQQTFTSYNILYKHRKTHTGQTPYACDICNRSFNDKSNLLRHGLVHTGVKNWTCDLCGKTFTQSNSLKLHTNTVHLKLPHPPRKPRKKKE